MCNRFHQLQDISRLVARFQARAEGLRDGPRYNIAPSEEAPAIPAAPVRTERRLLAMRFGLTPSWIGKPVMNLRAETFADKPFFRPYLMKRRCLIPADGFYEWKRTSRGSFPFRFTLPGGALFGLAGVEEDGAFAIITTEANSLVGQVHPRMPVILKPEDEDLWLDAGVSDFAALITRLAPFPAARMSVAQVSQRLNSARNKGPDVLQPDPAQQPLNSGPFGSRN